MDDPSDDECADPTWGMEDLDIVNDLPALDRKNFQFSNGFASLETVSYPFLPFCSFLF